MKKRAVILNRLSIPINPLEYISGLVILKFDYNEKFHVSLYIAVRLNPILV